MTEQELLRLKRDIDSAKEQVLELKGQQSQLKKQLKEDWDCQTVEQAQIKLDSLAKEREALEEKIEQETDKIQEMYGTGSGS